jgi:DNA-binding CsgD family transcriptional regulator
LKKVRELPKIISRTRRSNVSQPSFFVFCQKSTGAAQFRAEAGADPNFTVERMAGLLAMQCLARGSNPDDFDVLVAADRTFTNRLLSRASELLEEGRALAGPATLSPRQKEILHSVICNHANKEIAARLNITVRTVKFHISSLLNRFGVQNRAELARRAAGLLRPASLDGRAADRDELPQPLPQVLGPVAVSPALHLASKTRSGQFTRRVLSA